MPEKLITPDILLEITDNPAFESIFSESAADQDFLETFNKLTNANISFSSKPKDAISYLVDQATGFDGVVCNPQEMEKLVYLVYRSVYLPMKASYKPK
jgi:hypothetical protein